MTIEKLKNCPNCGGILDEVGRCVFCGSKVYDFMNISFDDPRSPSCAKTYIRIKVGNRIGILPVYPHDARLTVNSSAVVADYEGGKYLHKTNHFAADLEVNFKVFDDVIWYEEEQPDGTK